MFKVGIAHSLTAAMDFAASSLVANATRQLEGHTPVAGLLFSTIGLDHASLLEKLADLLPGCPIVGGSAYGEVSREQGYRLGSSVLILFASDTITIRAGVVRGLRFDDDAHNRATFEREFFAQPAQYRQPVLGLLFPDGLALDGGSIVKNFADLFPQTRFFGGAAAENFNLAATSQFFNREILHGSVPYLFFHGPLRYTWGVTEGFGSGWKAVGERFDARCESNWIKTINGRPAVEHLAERYRLDGGMLSVCHPFVIYPEKGQEEHYFRDIIHYSTDTGALESLQLLPAECQVQLTEPDPEAILDMSRQNIQQALLHFPGIAPPAVALWFSCVSRPLVLHSGPESEFNTAVANIPANLPVAGFYTYGEIAPASSDMISSYHSSTLVTLLLGEEPRPNAGLFSATPAFSLENLTLQNRQLSDELAKARDHIQALTQALEELKSQTRAFGHGRRETATRHRALALELVCQLLDEQFLDFKRLALKGEPPRLNRSGLARLISSIHRQRTGKPFPLAETQLARLLQPKEDDNHLI